MPTYRTAEDPPLDPDYEAWLDEVAKTCKAKIRPCDGCQQGGFCDGDNEQEAHDCDDVFYDEEDSEC